ncbi:PRP38-domain-containing protein [Suhomyces tanzawaensis NRRL Y-17324]|uniref:Pre-mRNA-splicing factor 38 n=1 Tax=Suhomyces tanzawaensis NRRL Y-17324 TaxID=984487 RepID=A0A1E4SP87_9ASCO|nr:PRP38-domain-containing protein [Suhomyces tanzawaensis NRRL Y-17324]ODV81339.1 PRP38-domain-containing protein [Suhomyces tanzawaensis NRRL Y-17324]
MTDAQTRHRPTYTDKRLVLNNANLVEPIVRHRIQDSVFYKQHLYLTNEATILPIIVSHVHYVAGTDSLGRPSPFVCCLLRLLELAPSADIVQVYLTQLEYNQFKYLTAMVMMYVRLTATSAEVYTTLEPYLLDLRKLRIRHKNPQFSDDSIPVHYGLTYIDVWADELLTKERVADLMLPRMVPRQQLVEQGVVQPRTYHVDNESEEDELDYESDSD